jgi:hypothetical protein
MVKSLAAGSRCQTASLKLDYRFEKSADCVMKIRTHAAHTIDTSTFYDQILVGFAPAAAPPRSFHLSRMPTDGRAFATRAARGSAAVMRIGRLIFAAG